MSFKKNLIKSRNYYDIARLASKMLFDNGRFAQLVERWMRSFLINKNFCLYYWFRKRIEKKLAFCIAITLEKSLLIFGREKFFNYVRTLLGHEANDNKVYYFQVTLSERIGEILWPKLSIGTKGTV